MYCLLVEIKLEFCSKIRSKREREREREGGGGGEKLIQFQFSRYENYCEFSVEHTCEIACRLLLIRTQS